MIDHPRMASQLLSLERRTSRGSRDSVDHPQGQGYHDDVINSAAGVLVYLAAKPANEYGGIFP
jgi:hypothetical protein